MKEEDIVWWGFEDKKLFPTLTVFLPDNLFINVLKYIKNLILFDI